MMLLTLSATGQQRPAIALFREDGTAQMAAATTPATAQLRQTRALSLDVAALDAALAPARRGGTVVLPLPDDLSARFEVTESAVLGPATAARFPELRTYAGRGLDNPDATTRLDITPVGFHGMILSGELGAVYLDPPPARRTVCCWPRAPPAHLPAGCSRHGRVHGQLRGHGSQRPSRHSDIGEPRDRGL